MACVFITKEVIRLASPETYGGAYDDMIAVCPFSGDVHILCRGQKKGRYDNIIIDNEQIHVFARAHSSTPFTYWGIARKEWTAERITPVGQTAPFEDLTKFKLKIDADNVIQEVIERGEHTGVGCYKRACLNRVGLYNFERVNIMSCFARL
jgi:hypothetical protein